MFAPSSAGLGAWADLLVPWVSVLEEDHRGSEERRRWPAGGAVVKAPGKLAQEEEPSADSHPCSRQVPGGEGLGMTRVLVVVTDPGGLPRCGGPTGARLHVTPDAPLSTPRGHRPG